MTITYPLTFPEGVTFNDHTLEIYTAATKNTSPFTLKTQTYDLGAERWQFSGALHRVTTRDVAEKYTSFKFALRGIVGTFLMSVPDGKTPRGSWLGTPVVDGGSQVGDTLNLKGFTPDETNVIREGDYLSLGTGSATRLYKALFDADSNGSGEVSVSIVPRLRESPGDNDTVTYENAMGIFRLSEPKSGYRAKPKDYTISFECEEALE